MDILSTPFATFDRAVLFFSAGKDSLATLLLLRPFWDRITVVWSNPGAPHQETLDYMEGIRAMVPDFVELLGDQPNWIHANGWPADVVPIRATREGEIGAGTATIRFQSYMSCCWANMWQPMIRYVNETEARLVIMGQRRDEALRNRMRDDELQEIEGITYWQPINEWSADDAQSFIRAQGYSLPPFYEQGAQSSADCWNCTAYLDHGKGRLNHMRKTEPERFAVVETVLMGLAEQLQRDTAALYDVLGG